MSKINAPFNSKIESYNFSDILFFELPTQDNIQIVIFIHLSINQSVWSFITQFCAYVFIRSNNTAPNFKSCFTQSLSHPLKFYFHSTVTN
jgi:hypothetical protein